jgi:hypothetical protein
MNLRDRGISSHERGPRIFIGETSRTATTIDRLSAEGVERGVSGEVHLSTATVRLCSCTGLVQNRQCTHRETD